MTILLISSSNFFSTYGGGQVYVKNIADEMIRQGMDITIISPDRNSREIVAKGEYRGRPLYTYMGKPVVATRCGGAEMQVDNSNGWLIEPNKAGEMRDLMIELAKNPQQIKAKSIHASEKVISIERHVGDLSEIYMTFKKK